MTNKTTPNNKPVSIVLLVHNEAEIIEKVVGDFLNKIVFKSPGSEILIAEDGSTDGTKEILARLTKQYPDQLKWIEGKEKKGYVRAFKEALCLPENENVLFCDCSGKHNPEDYWRMLPLLENNDLVLGYKQDRADPIYRVAMSRFFNRMVNLYFGVNYKDINCPLRLFKKSMFKKLCERQWIEKALVNFEFTLRAHYSGYRVAQIPVQHNKRVNGPSRGLPPKKIPQVVLDVLKKFPLLKAELRQLSDTASLERVNVNLRNTSPEV